MHNALKLFAVISASFILSGLICMWNYSMFGGDPYVWAVLSMIGGVVATFFTALVAFEK